MQVSSDGFKSIIGKNSTSDLVIGQSLSEKICCINPDQLGLGFNAPLNIQPECQSVSEHNSCGKV